MQLRLKTCRSSTLGSRYARGKDSGSRPWPVGDGGFSSQLQLQPFQHEPVTPIPWRSLQQYKGDRRDDEVNSAILISLMDLDKAVASLDETRPSFLLLQLRVTCKHFLNKTLAKSDQFAHGLRHLLEKAPSLPLVGASEVLHYKLESFAESVMEEAKADGLVPGKAEEALVDACAQPLPEPTSSRLTS